MSRDTRSIPVHACDGCNLIFEDQSAEEQILWKHCQVEWVIPGTPEKKILATTMTVYLDICPICMKNVRADLPGMFTRAMRP